MRVYVLMTEMDNGEDRPVAVVDNQDVADQFLRGGRKNDWVPLDLNDLSLTGLSQDPTSFKPTPTPPIQTGIENTTNNVDRANQALEQIMKRMDKRRRSSRNSLLE